jgi:hypothetical protein
MQPLDQQELIEKYLSGEMSAEQQQAVKTRMEQDAAFRVQVELHRQLHAEFADPRKLALRDMLSDIVQETPAAPPSANRWWWWGGLILLLLITGIWYTRQTDVPTSPTTPQNSSPDIQAPNQSPVAPVQPMPAPEPIAKATGPGFKVNPAFETRLGNGGIRSGSAKDVIVQFPTANANFMIENGGVALRFLGSLPPEGDIQANPLQIKIYNNQPNSKPVLELNPAIKELQDKWQYSISSKARLTPGVYYYTLEWTETEDLLYVGKFTVGGQ